MTKEMHEKLRNAANADDLLNLAKAAGLELTMQEAQTFFDALHSEKSGELSETELANVAGGLLFDDILDTKNQVEDC